MINVDDELRLAEVQDALAGAYSIERVLGRGGMGTVYLARDVSLDRPVAIKVLHPELATNETQKARFLAEARTGARLSHPHIVPIYAVDCLGDIVYFVMGLVDGESLAARLVNVGTLNAADTERILREVGWALAYAHASGLLHRDVTLDNILIERHTGRALLADFGIAGAIDDADHAELVGTPSYIAPELVQGEPPSIRSDLYALAISGWTMLAGRFPFAGDDTAAVLLQHVTAPLPSLAAAAPGTPSRLVGAIETALQRDASDRPADVEAFLALLERRSDAPVLATPLTRWATRWDRIRPAWAFATPMIAMVTMTSISEIFYLVARTGGPTTMWVYDALARTLIDMLRLPAYIVGGTLLLQGIFEFRELRRILKAGYGVRDLRLALRHDRRRQEPLRPTLLGRLMHDMTWLGLLTGAILLVISSQAWRYNMSYYDDARDLAGVLGEIGRWCWVIVWTGLGASFALPVSPVRSVATNLSDRFWRSRAGAWLARLAAWRLDSNRTPEQTLHRPTELVLELAIEDLWNALPADAQANLAALPSVAESLRERLSEMKELSRHLAEPAHAQRAEADQLRQRLADRQAETLDTLERIRLRLGQLSGEAGPQQALTNQIGSAQQLEHELALEMGAHPSLRRLLQRPTRRGASTPTPSPAMG